MRILFDDEEIFEPSSWEETSEVLESVNQTEAGTDQIAIVRYDKLSVSCSFQCSHRWAQKFKAYSTKDQLSVSFYDILAGENTVRIMRIRDFKAQLAEHSWRTPGTNGLWNISFTLKEF